MPSTLLITCLLLSQTINLQAQENPNEFMYSPCSGNYAASFVINQKLLGAIAGAKAQALIQGINLGGFTHLSVRFEGEKIFIAYFDLGTLEIPCGEVELIRPDFAIKSIK